jgi:hypothetical protein
MLSLEWLVAWIISKVLDEVREMQLLQQETKEVMVVHKSNGNW